MHVVSTAGIECRVFGSLCDDDETWLTELPSERITDSSIEVKMATEQ